MDFTFLNKDSSFLEESKADRPHDSPSVSSPNAGDVAPVTPTSGRREDCDEDDGYMTPSSEESRIPATPTSGRLEDCDEDDGYMTPSSEESRIPAIRPCPPAPRKRRLASKNNDSLISPPSKKFSGKRQLMSRRRTAVLLKLFQFQIPEIWHSIGGAKIKNQDR